MHAHLPFAALQSPAASFWMTSVQLRIEERLRATSQEATQHLAASSKRLVAVTKDSDGRASQLVQLQQDLLYITQALRRMQRLCDQHADRAQ